MKFILFMLSIGFYLEGIYSNFVSISTRVFNPLFSLITLVLIYPFFKEKRKYLLVCFGYGILYDFIYTDTLIFHGLLFLLIGYLSCYMHKLFSFNFLNIILITSTSILFYRLLSYIFLCLVGGYSFIWIKLLYSITSSIIINIFFAIILYLFFKPRYHYIKV